MKRASKADKKAQRLLHVVIADACPLIALSLIDSLHWLGQLFGQVQAVQAVLAEVLPGAFNTSEQRIGGALESGILTVVEDGECAGAEDAGTLALQNVIQQAMLDAGEAMIARFRRSWTGDPHCSRVREPARAARRESQRRQSCSCPRG